MNVNPLVQEVVGSAQVREQHKEPMMYWQQSLQQNLFSKMNDRQARRKAETLMHEYELMCSKNLNTFFRFAAKEKNNEAQQQEMLRLDKCWKNWLRGRSDKYDYANCKDYFATKLLFFIGDKVSNQQLLDKIAAVEKK